MRKVKYLLWGLVFISQAILLVGCDLGNGISSLSVEKVVNNPRIYEEKEVSVVGTLVAPDERLKVVNINGRIDGTGVNQSIYLKNMIAKVEYGSKVIVKGVFDTINLPILGTYLVIDAKSVEPCTKMSLC